ncbi:MAG: alpha/beta fold hydrolase [Acidimicrobiales bacterium]
MPSVASADGVVIAVHDLGGDPSADTLLLAHATGFHGRAYQPMVDDGLAARFRCLAPDLRGHGDSPATAEQVRDWARFGDDVLAVIDGTGVTDGTASPHYGFGHSMGGAALVLAELARPGTFAGLWLFEPILPPATVAPADDGGAAAARRGGEGLAAAAARRREVFDSVDAAAEHYSSKPPMDVFTPEAMRAYVEHGFAPLLDGTVRLKCRGAIESAGYGGAMDHHAFDRLGELGCPVVVGMGAAVGAALLAPAIAAAIPHGRLERFTHLGHFAPQQAPTEIATAIRQAFSTQ